MKKNAFTLVELMIVVSILGILAAIVIPQLQGNTVQAKESSAKFSLSTMRSQIQLYKMQHDNPPAYVNGTAFTTESFFINQMTGISNAKGGNNSATVPTSTFPLGPYLNEIPPNPINGLSSVKIFTTDVAFSTQVDGLTGWLYRALSGEITLNSTGTDTANVNYYDY